MSALLYIPPNATAQNSRPRDSRDSRLHQLAGDAGWICHRICPPRLRGARPRPDRPWLQRSAGLRRRLWRARWAGASAQPRHGRQIQYRSRRPLHGGWAVLAAATAMPNDYKSMVLEGSSTGKPFAADGTPGWPRNVALVFAQYEEFSNLMWGVDRARCHSKPETLGPVRHPRRGRIRQALWRRRAGHRQGAPCARDHASRRAYFASSDRLQPRLVR